MSNQRHDDLGTMPASSTRCWSRSPSLPVGQPVLLNVCVELVAALVRAFRFVTLLGIFLVRIGKIDCNQIEHSFLSMLLPLHHPAYEPRSVNCAGAQLEQRSSKNLHEFLVAQRRFLEHRAPPDFGQHLIGNAARRLYSKPRENLQHALRARVAADDKLRRQPPQLRGGKRLEALPVFQQASGSEFPIRAGKSPLR